MFTSELLYFLFHYNTAISILEWSFQGYHYKFIKSSQQNVELLNRGHLLYKRMSLEAKGFFAF